MEMFSTLEILVGLVLVGFVYWWINFKKFERKLNWIPKVPGNLIFGNALDFGKSTDTLKILSRYVNQCNGLCTVDLIVTKIVVVSDVEFLEFLLTSTTILNKSREYKFLNRWLGNGLLTADGGARWKNSRKIITPSFHFSILKQFIPIYETNADIMINLLDAQIGKDAVDVYPFVTMCALDIICETSMGVSINAQLDRQSNYVLAVNEMTRIIVDRSFSPIKQLNLLYPLTRDFYKELKCVKTLHSHTESVIRSRREELKCATQNNEISDKGGMDKSIFNNQNKVAFLDLLLQASLDGNPLPDSYIREEVNTLMFEGHDTTSSAISFALFCLAENPQIQDQVVEEQRSIFDKDKNRAITFQDIQEMRYLELVIKETLRLYPSVPYYARSPDKDIVYKDGQIIPKGTSLLLFVYGLHKNPKIFSDPEKFDPSRFEKMESPFIYLPFSAGSRNCIGQKFAMQEMKVVLSKMLRNFEILPSTPKHIPILTAEAVLKSANGIKIKIKRRDWH